MDVFMENPGLLPVLPRRPGTFDAGGRHCSFSFRCIHHDVCASLSQVGQALAVLSCDAFMRVIVGIVPKKESCL